MSRWTKRLLWGVYISLLAVLLPHTSWAFGQFEPPGWRWLGWVGALAFEGAIAALTWRLKQAIEQTPNFKKLSIRIKRRYLNFHAVGLLTAIIVSSAANWAHAVEFGQPFGVFARYSVPPILYSVAFGGILPLCSLLFAHILADVQETEHEEDEALVEANAKIRELRQEIRETEQRAVLAEQRFQAIGDMAIMLFGDEKRQRILAAHQLWPQLPQRSIAVIAETSPGYVSDTLSEPEREEQET